MLGYIGKAKAQVKEFEVTMVTTNGQTLPVYKLHLVLSTRWDKVLDQEVNINEEFGTEQFNLNAQLSYWLNPVVKEGKKMSQAQFMREQLKQVFDYHSDSGIDYTPQVLTENLVGRECVVVCKRNEKNEKYTDVTDMYNINGKPTREVNAQEQDALLKILNQMCK